MFPPVDEVVRRTTRVFHGWIEDWKQEDVGPKGCPIFEQRIIKKYGGLKFLDPDGGRVFSVHTDRTSFQKKKGANSYELFCILDDFDDPVDDDNQEDKWEECFRDVAIEEIAEYCNKHKKLGVLVYKKGEINESYVDEEGEEVDASVVDDV